MLSKYNKTLDLTNAMALKVYKRIYDEKIKESKNYGLYDKLIYHPDLTKIDYEYLTQQKN
jgi:hypothetical protein